MVSNTPPFVLFFLAAALVPLARGRVRAAFMLLIPVLGGLRLLGVDQGVYSTLSIVDYQLTLFRVDKLSLLFGYLFHIASFLSILFALHVRDTTQHVAGLLYAGSALGAVFAGDLITLFIFWEGMAVSSTFLIWARGTARSTSTGQRYLIIQVVSGVLLLAGALLHLRETGSLAFEYIGLGGVSSWLILLSFGIKAAFPLLHNWLTDAYPEATPTGTVFLSAFTTKTAIYALARGYPGTELLVYVGTIMTCFPIFYAVIENDLRRVLAYSMVNQLGFMVCGVGIGTALSVNGAVAHAFVDVIFKGLLFMSMGAVLHMTGTMKGSALGGLHKTMPKTTILCIVGAASISAFPLFSGFVSKSMVMAAALEEGYHGCWLLLLFASAGVFHHAGIKIPYFAFFAHDSGIRVSDPPKNMLAAMTIAAVLCVAIGSYPWPLYSLLPNALGYSPYDATHVLTQTQLLFFSALAFVWLQLQGLYPPELRSVNIDAEWFYRRLAPRLLRPVGAALNSLRTGGDAAMQRLANRLSGMLSVHHGPAGILARTVATNRMVLWTLGLLGSYLLFFW
ncbi:MAG: Na(+)/H(+) antiporter subunit D [Nitrospirota bacterium]|jgi:multicomponent Na+:H+ antiporter subunit D